MKKKCIGFLAGIIGFVMLTGCGTENTLTCSQVEEEEEFGKMTENIILYFNGDSTVINKVTINEDVELKEESYVDIFKKSLEEQCDDFKDDDTKCNVSVNKNKVRFEVIKENIKENDDDLGEVSAKTTKEDAKTYFEKQGYTCK